MSRLFRALVILLLVASCGGGGGSGTSPDNLDNACSILQQRPTYYRAFKATERKWGVPVHVQMATIYQESKFDSDARTPLKYSLGVIPMGRQSSAFGYSQALDGTWDEYRRATGRHGAKRDNIRDATDFIGWYMNRSREKNGIALSDEEFLEKYRLHRSSFWRLVAMIKAHPVFDPGTEGVIQRRKQAPVAMQLLVFLNYIGTSGSGASNPRQRNAFSIGRGTAQVYRQRCVTAIRSLQDQAISWPDEQERKGIA